MASDRASRIPASAEDEARFLALARQRGVGDVGDEGLLTAGGTVCFGFRAMYDPEVAMIEMVKRYTMESAGGRLSRHQVDVLFRTAFDVLCPEAEPKT